MKNDISDPADTKAGDLTVATDCPDNLYQTYWYRGEWQDQIVTFWNEFNSAEDLKDRIYTEPRKAQKKDVCTLVAKLFSGAGERKSVRFVLTWNIPNYEKYWKPMQEDGTPFVWKNYYATVFEDSSDSAAYSLENWDMLWNKTNAFKKALFENSVDPVFNDAISANLSVLKSPTVLRLEDGSFWGWEGVLDRIGSCEGTCQHVWNYAYALCFLFPDLERSIRDAEFKYGTFEDGRTVFRLTLPYGGEPWDFRPCLDGQMGTVIKFYREWKLSGDDAWLKKNWETVKKILEYAWSEKNPDGWDGNRDGVLEGRQHHTLDMELYGPSSWLQGMYMAALKAAAEIAEYLGESDKSAEYTEIYNKGYTYTKNELFNGEYFIQKVDLKDKSLVERYEFDERYWNTETEEIKYQIAHGSSIDQLLGLWHTTILGLGEIFDREQVEKALDSMMKYNFKDSMRDYANPWRIFCVNDEAGTVICDYPDKNNRPSIPIAYCEETMTGFEYSFAGLLIRYGRIDDAKKVVKAVRDRYDGKKRNPWNEIECGNNYARSMASFALLPILSGFEFDLPHSCIGFAPKTEGDFKCPWFAGTAWGELDICGNEISIGLFDGEIELSSIGLKFVKDVKSVTVDGRSVGFSFNDGYLSFEGQLIKNNVKIAFLQ